MDKEDRESEDNDDMGIQKTDLTGLWFIGMFIVIFFVIIINLIGGMFA